MAGSSDNVNVWESGDVFVAPVGTTAPLDVTTAWATPWVALGLLSEDGLTESIDQSSDVKSAWGGNTVRVVKGAHSRTFVVTVLEDTPAVFALINPGSTQATTTGLTTRVVKKPIYNPKAFGFETKDGTTTSRIIVPKGEVTEVGDTVRQEGDLMTRELTITVYPASDGVLYRELTNAPGAVVA